MRLIWKLLRQHISIPQLLGFFFANLVGLTIILLGVQFYEDYSALNSEDSFMKADYLIVNKKISSLSSLSGHISTFSASDIEELGEEDFVEHIGAFTPSSFNVKASFDFSGFAKFSTDMFFESVPDAFVDVESEDWHYDLGSRDIPIILPKNYLDLYNFGYAQGKGLPKLNAGILGALKLRIDITGNGHHDTYDGRIVGFSSRLNTILVPESFMKWANGHYTTGQTAKEPSRLIMEVDNPADERITSFLREHNYETDEDKLDASKTNFILRTVVSIVMLVGFVICALSFYILMLSIFLLVQKNSSKLENLLLIGYSPAKVSLPYQVLTIVLNLVVLVLALAIMFAIRHAYLSLFASMFPDYDTPSPWLSIAVGAFLLLFVSAFNVVAVRRKVMGIWNNKGKN